MIRSMALNRPSLAAIFLSAAVLAGPAPAAVAQPCEPEWVPILGLSEFAPSWGGDINAFAVWDPPGGPGPRLVVGGSFVRAGDLEVNHIAAFDLATGEWSGFKGGMNWPVWALAVMPNGDLVAGGGFTRAGSENANWVARWDGQRWHAMDGGMRDGITHFEFLGGPPGVHTLVVSPGGELFAGGNFLRAGRLPASHIARWNGDTWQPLSSEISGYATVFALAFTPGGDLIAGGYFDNASGIPAENIARWNGMSWSPLGSGIQTPGWPGLTGVWAVTTLSTGEVIAGGPITGAGGTPMEGAAMWDGVQWRPVGDGPHFSVTFSLLTLEDHSVLAGGWGGISRWDGATWTRVADTSALGYALATLPTGDVVAGGRISIAGETVELAIWRDCSPCYADCDASGSLDFFDFLCFQRLFAAGDPLADCDESGQLDFFDFLCFQNAFAAGCE